MPQANNIQTPNIAGNFLNAFQAGTQTRQAREKENALNRIGQTAATGDLEAASQEALQAGRFDVFGQIQGAIDKADEKTLTATKLYNADVARAAFNATTPEAWDAGIDDLSSRYPSRAAELQQLKGQFSEEARQRAISRGLTIDQMITQREKVQGKLETIFDPQTGQPLKALVDAQGNIVRNVGGPKATSGTELSVDPETGAVTFRQGSGVTGTGRQPLTKPTTTAIQKELVGLEEQQARVDTIAERYRPEFLTFAGGFEAGVTALQSKLGVDPGTAQTEFIKARTKFIQGVEREFNSYRKLITGAAASVQELESLKKAVINTDQSPVEFEAALELYQEEVQRALRIKREMLSEGISVQNDDFGDEFDRRFLSEGGVGEVGPAQSGGVISFDAQGNPL